MTYLSDRKQSKNKWQQYLFFVAVLSILVYAWPTLRVKVYPYIESVIFGYGSTKHAFTIVPSSVQSYFTSRASLLEKDRALELNIERLENALAEKNAALREKELLAFNGTTPPLPQSTLVMYPVMRDITSLYKSIVLSKGFKDGVELKSLVYVRGRQPVCIITEIYDKTSLCTLLSASGESVEGLCYRCVVTVVVHLLQMSQEIQLSLLEILLYCEVISP
jgi:cell shape-determining protein MreC